MLLLRFCYGSPHHPDTPSPCFRSVENEEIGHGLRLDNSAEIGHGLRLDNSQDRLVACLFVCLFVLSTTVVRLAIGMVVSSITSGYSISKFLLSPHPKTPRPTPKFPTLKLTAPSAPAVLWKTPNQPSSISQRRNSLAMASNRTTRGGSNNFATEP